MKNLIINTETSILLFNDESIKATVKKAFFVYLIFLCTGIFLGVINTIGEFFERYVRYIITARENEEKQ